MEINRATVKAQARELIKGRVFTLFLIIAAVGFLCGGISGFFSTNLQQIPESFQGGIDNFNLDNFQSNNGVTVFSNLSTVLVVVFAPLNIALAGLFLGIIKGAQYDIGGEFTYVFKNTFDSNYVQKFLLKLLVGIFTFLWALLFIIPGIVYRYKTYFVDYIMAENPNLSWQETIELSKKMTNGHKGELFVFDLSFFLWYMLAGITCGIALIYVSPYVVTSQALYYENFKLRGLQTGEINQQDFLSQSEKMAQNYNNGFGTQNQPNQQFNAPQQQYQTPQAQQYQTPVQPQYQAPVQPQYQPPQPQYQAPVQPQYQPPQPQQNQPPVQPQYQPPQPQVVEPQYQAPQEPAPQPAEPVVPQEESFYTPPADAQQYFTPTEPVEPEIPAEPATPVEPEAPTDINE